MFARGQRLRTISVPNRGLIGLPVFVASNVLLNLDNCRHNIRVQYGFNFSLQYRSLPGKLLSEDPLPNRGQQIDGQLL